MTTILHSSSVSNSFTGGAAASNSTSNDDYEQFMNILLTQLQHQNPASPMDAETFTSQLVQYSSLEQLLAMHDALDVGNETLTDTKEAQALSYVGHRVEINDGSSVMQGTTTTGDDGEASYEGYAAWTVNLASAAEVEIKITDESGNLVYSTTKSAHAGDNTFILSSEDLGDAAADGKVLVMTATAKDATGETVKTDANGIVTVESVDVSGEDNPAPLLQAGGLKFKSDYVLSVS